MPSKRIQRRVQFPPQAIGRDDSGRRYGWHSLTAVSSATAPESLKQDLSIPCASSYRPVRPGRADSQRATFPPTITPHAVAQTSPASDSNVRWKKSTVRPSRFKFLDDGPALLARPKMGPGRTSLVQQTTTFGSWRIAWASPTAPCQACPSNIFAAEFSWALV